MLTASAATKAILAAGMYLKAEFYKITLIGGTILYFTSWDVPLTVGGNLYKTGLTIHRGPISRKAGLEVQTLELTIAPQDDNPGGVVTVGGFPFLQAVNAGVFDAALILFSKGFFNMPVPPATIDTTPGLVPCFQGEVNDATAGRFTASIKIESDSAQLNVAMPKNVIQTGCVHSLFDAGCALVKAAFTTSGAASGTPGVLQFNTNLTQVNGYFDLGVVTWTSGPNSGLSFPVKSHLNASGQVTLAKPMPNAPAAGNTFTIVPACLKTKAACSNASAAVSAPFNNLVHFRGMPFVPVPETLYDGGTSAGAAPAIAGQGGPGTGSSFGGALGAGTYVP